MENMTDMEDLQAKLKQASEDFEKSKHNILECYSDLLKSKLSEVKDFLLPTDSFTVTSYTRGNDEGGSTTTYELHFNGNCVSEDCSLDEEELKRFTEEQLKIFDDFVFLFDDFMYQIKQKDLSCYSVVLKCGFKVKETWG